VRLSATGEADPSDHATLRQRRQEKTIPFPREGAPTPKLAHRARGEASFYPQSLHHLNTVLTKRSILFNRRSSNLKILLEKGWLAALQAKRIFGARVLLFRKGIPSSREGAPHKTVWQPMMKS
jgi:hypothetical protein